MPLVEYCKEYGIRERHIRMAIYYTESSGIVAMGAVEMVGKRWYVVLDKIDAWVEANTRRWSSRQIKP